LSEEEEEEEEARKEIQKDPPETDLFSRKSFHLGCHVQ
jgi:hypothetical protein